ncbi:MAG: ATP-binding protein [Saprospiraceae bacterium]|nr:ATP-binding protein [Saprospiraceae bacterium]
MRLRYKLALAFGLFFAAVVLVATLGAWSIHYLNGATRIILEDNYDSIEYVQDMFKALDQDSFPLFAMALDRQQHNITEPDEEVITQSIADAFAALKNASAPEKNVYDARIREGLHRVLDLNQAAIVSKSETARRQGESVYQWIVAISTLMVLLLFSFLLNLPTYISEPLTKLRDGIRRILHQDYSTRVEVRGHDELGELAAAFNEMAQKLDFWEHSNWARVLFEKKRIEAIIDGLQDAVIGVDEHQQVLFVNPVMEKLLGLKAATLLGQNALELALHNDLLRRLMRSEEPKELNIVLDNKECWFKPEIQAVESDKHFLGKVILLKNVTPYRALDEAKTNFIATISHELKTPIAALQMSLRLLNDDRVGNTNEEQKLLVQQMRSDLSRLQRITGELLDLAQVESGNLRLNMTPTTADFILEHTESSVEVALREKKLALHIEKENDLPMVRVDAEKTTWVMINLLTNAIKFSPEGSSIYLSVKKEGDFVSFAVRDQGPGIDPQFIDRIFDRFFRAPYGMGKEGAGIGLSIARDFLEAQGGRIQVHSTPGKGAEFVCQLPVA